MRSKTKKDSARQARRKDLIRHGPIIQKQHPYENIPYSFTKPLVAPRFVHGDVIVSYAGRAIGAGLLFYEHGRDEH
jgi:hypothetical protein